MKYKMANWEKFQQYKDGRPLRWIKLGNSLLDDYQFNQLPEITQLHLIKLWLLASKSGGEIEGDNNWLARLINAKKLDIERLVRDGLIIRTESYENLRESTRVEESRVEKIREDKSREEKNIVTLKPDRAADVFEYWQITLNHKKSVLDNDRRALINKWLKCYDADYLKKAIHGCSVTPFNMGENDRGQRYDSLKLIFKNADQIDRFANNSDNPPTGKVKTLQQTQNQSLAQAERIKKNLGIK